MQWLFDIIEEMMEAAGFALQSWVQAQGYLTTGYIDRGPSLLNDWDENDLTQDGLWHTLDMSAVIPAGAKAVNLHYRGLDANVGRILFMRPAGDTTIVGTCFVRNQVANVAVGGWAATSISSDRKVEYKSLAPGYTTINFKVRGWWL